MVDETFVAAPPEQVAVEVADAARWRRWWPDLRLELVHDRGPAGLRWRVGGALHGTLELWLEAVGDGTVIHHLLRAEVVGPGGEALPGRRVGALVHERRVQAKVLAFEVKALLEHGRAAGEPPPDPPQGDPR